MNQNIHEIAIIGDGFAAAAMVMHLLRRGIPPSALLLIGPGVLGKGNAYTCASPHFRLNVREDLPWIFSEDPLHFARWAKMNIDDSEAKTDAGYFYRRYDFGRYVAASLENEPGSDQIARLPATVGNLRKVGQHWRLEINHHDALGAKRVIIATGNPPPIWPCPVNVAQTEAASSRLIESPWTGSDLGAVQGREDVILLGGGLTALDAINALVGQSHQGIIKVIGPRGIFPPSQATWTRHSEPDWPQNLTPAKLIAFMRNYLPDAPTDSTQWQIAWEELRPNLSTVWQQFSPHQRRSLFKRLGWLWSLYRFRASPQTIAAYQQLKANQQIEFVLGRAKQIDNKENKVSVLLDDGARVEGDRIFNCTGVGRDPLLGKLIANQVAIPDSLGQSIAVSACLSVCRPDGGHWNTLWMIGPGTMGSLGDVIAASAIAKQAEQLSKLIKAGSF